MPESRLARNLFDRELAMLCRAFGDPGSAAGARAQYSSLRAVCPRGGGRWTGRRVALRPCRKLCSSFYRYRSLTVTEAARVGSMTLATALHESALQESVPINRAQPSPYGHAKA